MPGKKRKEKSNRSHYKQNTSWIDRYSKQAKCRRKRRMARSMTTTTANDKKKSSFSPLSPGVEPSLPVFFANVERNQVKYVGRNSRPRRYSRDGETSTTSHTCPVLLLLPFPATRASDTRTQLSTLSESFL